LRKLLTRKGGSQGLSRFKGGTGHVVIQGRQPINKRMENKNPANILKHLQPEKNGGSSLEEGKGGGQRSIVTQEAETQIFTSTQKKSPDHSKETLHCLERRKNNFKWQRGGKGKRDYKDEQSFGSGEKEWKKWLSRNSGIDSRGRKSLRSGGCITVKNKATQGTSDSLMIEGAVNLLTLTMQVEEMKRALETEAGEKEDVPES